MSISSRITEIEGHLEDDYTALEQLGVSVEDRNIENIKDVAQQIYNKFPKTDYAEGSNITLSNTLKGKLDFENNIVGYGQTSQEGTPTPETPIDIEVVRGKNRFNGTLRQGVTNYDTGIYSNAPHRITTTDWLTLPRGTYTISAKTSTNKTLKISNITFDVNGNFYNISGVSGQWKTFPFTITLPQDTKWQCNICYSDNSDITPSEVSEVQIEKGSQATSYLPYNTIEVVERGKNLAHIEAEGKYRSSASGNFSINANYNGYIANVRQNTTYTGGFTNMSSNYNDVSNLCYFDKNMIFISGEAYNTANKTFTTPSNCAYVTMAVKTTIIDFQVEEGSTATTYEPYQEPITYQLSLGEYEFAKIGNYVDTIEYDVENDKVYKNKAINIRTFDGSEGWIANNPWNTNYPSTFHAIGQGIINDNTYAEFKMTHFTTQLGRQGKYEGNMAYFESPSSYRVLIIFIEASNLSEFSTNGFNNWLSINKPSIAYPLEEPIKEEITGTLKDQIKALYYSHSFTGTTIIEIDGNLPLVIKVRALKGE